MIYMGASDKTCFSPLRDPDNWIIQIAFCSNSSAPVFMRRPFSVIPKSSAPPSHLSPPPFCWQRCGRGGLLAERLFIWTAEWWPVCCGPSLPQPPPPPGLRRGVQPICDSKGRAHLERRLRPGVPLLPRGSSAQYDPKTLGMAASFPLLSTSQPTDSTWGMRSPLVTEGDGQKSSWIDFPAGAVTLINIFAAPLYVSVFPSGRDATEAAVSRWRSNLQVVRLRLHFSAK